MKHGKWTVSRRDYRGKNCLGEKIYHVWFVKTQKACVGKIKIDVVVDTKMEIVLE